MICKHNINCGQAQAFAVTFLKMQQTIYTVRQKTKGCSYKIPATLKDIGAATKQQLAISKEIDSKLLPIFPAFNSSNTEISFQRVTEEQG